MPDSPKSRNPALPFPRRMRLSGAAAFDRIYATKVFANLGNFVVHGAPNDLGHPRLGFAVPRRVGTAVVRNTIKRRLREALRLMQHDWTDDAAGYDLVLSVRPHEPLSTAEYKPLIGKAMRQMHSQWTRRLNNPKHQA